MSAPDVEPEVYWIGDIPLLHGERDNWDGEWGTTPACLCGHPNYLLCPEQEAGGVMSLILGLPYGGRLDEAPHV